MKDPRWDDETRDRLDEIDKRYRRFARRTDRILTALVAVALVSAGVNYHVLDQGGQRAKEGTELSKANRRLVLQIQKSRRDAILSACHEVNRRNAKAYLFLRSLPPSPNQPQRSPAETRKLIHRFTDALVGKRRNCNQRARQLLNPKPRAGRHP